MPHWICFHKYLPRPQLEAHTNSSRIELEPCLRIKAAASIARSNLGPYAHRTVAGHSNLWINKVGSRSSGRTPINPTAVFQLT